MGWTMKYVFQITVAVLLTAFFGHSASAQSRSTALTNADVIRLAAMGVSDQTVIAVIHEAKATRFDLSPQAVSKFGVSGVSTAVIATMRQSSTRSAGGLEEPAQSPAAGAQRLAGTAAKAAAAPSTRRPQLSIAGPSSPPVLPTLASTSQDTKPVGTSGTTTIIKDEAYWKDQMRGLQGTLDSDVIVANEMLRRFGIYNDLLSNSSHVVDREPRETNDNSVLSRVTATVKSDKRNIADLEEQARRAGVLPGWLRNP